MNSSFFPLPFSGDFLAKINHELGPISLPELLSLRRTSATPRAPLMSDIHRSLNSDKGEISDSPASNRASLKRFSIPQGIIMKAYFKKKHQKSFGQSINPRATGSFGKDSLHHFKQESIGETRETIEPFQSSNPIRKSISSLLLKEASSTKNPENSKGLSLPFRTRVDSPPLKASGINSIRERKDNSLPSLNLNGLNLQNSESVPSVPLRETSQRMAPSRNQPQFSSSLQISTKTKPYLFQSSIEETSQTKIQSFIESSRKKDSEILKKGLGNNTERSKSFLSSKEEATSKREDKGTSSPKKRLEIRKGALSSIIEDKIREFEEKISRNQIKKEFKEAENEENLSKFEKNIKEKSKKITEESTAKFNSGKHLSKTLAKHNDLEISLEKFKWKIHQKGVKLFRKSAGLFEKMNSELKTNEAHQEELASLSINLKTRFSAETKKQKELRLKRGFRKAVMSCITEMARLKLTMEEICSGKAFSKSPHEKPNSKEFFKAVKRGDIQLVEHFLSFNRFLIFDFDLVTSLYSHLSPFGFMFLWIL